jgi:hypothetical protein
MDLAPDPLLFVSDLQDAKEKSFFPMFLCLFLFEGTSTFTSFFKDKKSNEVKKTGEIKVFLHIFACWWKDPDS